MFWCHCSVTRLSELSFVLPRQWNESVVQHACQLLAEDLTLKPGAPGGQVEYRRSLATSFFFKFYLNVSQRLSNNEVGNFFLDNFRCFSFATHIDWLSILRYKQVLVLSRFHAVLTQRSPFFLDFPDRMLGKSVFDLVNVIALFFFGFCLEIDHIVLNLLWIAYSKLHCEHRKQSVF